MKPNQTFITGVIIGGLLVFLGCWIYQSARIAALRVHFDSDIKRPVEVMLTDINKTADDGDTDLALKKLRLFEQLWRKYRQGGETPELFINKVTSLRDGQRESSQ